LTSIDEERVITVRYKNWYNNNTFRLLSKFDKVFKLTLTNDGYL